MLAVFRVGGIALPLDASLPLNRKFMMLAEASAYWILLEEDDQEGQLLIRANGVTAISWYCNGNSFIADESSNATTESSYMPTSISLRDPAYIFFTSGTTGKSKGVVGCHESLAHFINWQMSEFAVGLGDRVAQLASFSFDAMLKDVFLALCSGAALSLPMDNPYEHPDLLIDWLETEQVTIVQTVPSVVASWLAAQSVTKATLRQLRLLCLAGEPLNGELVMQWRDTFKTCSAETINLYGTTESTILKSFYRVPAFPTHGILPIGLPIPGAELEVVNQSGEICGIGELGEIIIKTAYGTIGTVDHMIEGMLVSNNSKWVAYQTGDLGRYELDGLIKIFGRADDQIKLRGVRIQPQEVIAILSEHPSLQTCTVVDRTDQMGEPVMAAYVIPNGSANVTSDMLRDYLKLRLPQVMIPSSFTVLSHLPLTANGKVDRAALPQPNAHKHTSQQLSILLTPTQEVIANIWSEVLKCNQPRLHDNFFETGGHSLLAVQIIARIRKACKCDIGVRAFFDTPTVAALAEQVDASLSVSSRLSIPPLLSTNHESPIPLSFAQQRLWFLAQLDHNDATYNMSGTLRVPSYVTLTIIERCLSEIIRRHQILRTRFAVRDGQPLQMIAPPTALPIDSQT
ncbi:MAG: AMP-binding protein [Pleurocapsa sp. CRU_1_2]|nr:AMP-binding protein [Pleurocapsa sp. CRU_1_2]